MRHRLPAIDVAISIALTLSATSAESLAVYDDGGTHTIDNVVNDDVQVTNGTRLRIGGAAEVRGTGAPSPLPGGVWWPVGGVVTVGAPPSYAARNTLKSPATLALFRAEIRPASLSRPHHQPMSACRAMPTLEGHCITRFLWCPWRWSAQPVARW